MKEQELKTAIIEYAMEIGISKIGFTDVEPFTKLGIVLEHRQACGHQSDFESKDLVYRIDPRILMPQAATVISIAIAYPSQLPASVGKTSDISPARGEVSRSAWGRDYHYIVGEKLELLANLISKLVPGAESQNYVDRTGLLEKALAERAGIGWIGRNSLLITPEYGSYVFLGELLTTVKLEVDQPIAEQCGECRICIDACPNQAILENRAINSQRCLSEITQQKKLDSMHYEVLGTRIYGCDTCQEVCPRNHGAKPNLTVDFQPLAAQARPLLLGILEMTNRQFAEKWRKTAAGWRGKSTLQRNAIIALANLDEISALTQIEKLTEDGREEIRKAASWAKKQLTVK